MNSFLRKLGRKWPKFGALYVARREARARRIKAAEAELERLREESRSSPM